MVVVLSSPSFRRRIITFPLDCNIALLVVVVVATDVFIAVVAEVLEVAASPIVIVDDFVSFIFDGSSIDDLSLSAAAVVASAESPKVGFLLGKGSPKGGGLQPLAIYSCKHNCK